MEATINHKGMNYESVELASIKSTIVSFRISKTNEKHMDYIEQLVSDGADVDFYKDYTFAIVLREHVTSIIYL